LFLLRLANSSEHRLNGLRRLVVGVVALLTVHINVIAGLAWPSRWLIVKRSIPTAIDALEIFVEGHLAAHQPMQAEAVWLVGQVPLDVRRQLNLPYARAS
jgi:hypothetical protein